MSELLPCPFCGGRPALGEVRRGDKLMQGFLIECEDCTANLDRCETEDEAIASWNRRAQQAQPAPSAEALIRESRATMRALSEASKHEPDSILRRECSRAVVAIDLLCLELAPLSPVPASQPSVDFEAAWQAAGIADHENVADYRHWMRKGWDAARASGAEPVAWREHVERCMHSWRQRFVNKSGDSLALDDFMDKESLDDLLDYVLDEYASPVAAGEEPVAHICILPTKDAGPTKFFTSPSDPRGFPVYTSPVARQPLTEEQIEKLLLEADWPPSMISPFVQDKLTQLARAIERAHGIGSQEGA